MKGKNKLPYNRWQICGVMETKRNIFFFFRKSFLFFYFLWCALDGIQNSLLLVFTQAIAYVVSAYWLCCAFGYIFSPVSDICKFLILILFINMQFAWQFMFVACLLKELQVLCIHQSLLQRLLNLGVGTSTKLQRGTNAL